MRQLRQLIWISFFIINFASDKSLGKRPRTQESSSSEENAPDLTASETLHDPGSSPESGPSAAGSSSNVAPAVAATHSSFPSDPVDELSAPVFSAASDPQTAPSCALVTLHGETTDLAKLLHACFDKATLERCGVPKNDEFVIRGRDGPREIELSFYVTAIVENDGKGYRCKLDWDAGVFPVGSLKSTINGEPTERIIVPSGAVPLTNSLLWGFTGISIEIFGGPQPVWELKHNQPNNLVSSNFLKNFFALALREHERLTKKFVPLRMSDFDALREIYWLIKGIGKTFLEDHWNMQYDCLLKLGKGYSAIRELSKKVMGIKAKALLQNRVYNPLQNEKSWYEPIRYFSEDFKREMDEWFTPERDFGDMSAHAAILEFMNIWKARRKDDDSGLKYDSTTQVKLAQDTFVFFFRYQPQFRILARQVLSGFDDDCILMSGRPEIGESNFNFQFSKGTGRSVPMTGRYGISKSRAEEALRRAYGPKPPNPGGPTIQDVVSISSPDKQVANWMLIVTASLLFIIIFSYFSKHFSHHSNAKVNISFYEKI